MILDGSLVFDSNVAITATAQATNSIDLGEGRDMGIGDISGATPKLLALVTQSFASAGGATLQLLLQGSTDNATWKTYAESRVFAVADLVAGNTLLRMDWPRPNVGDALPRYLSVNYLVGTSTFSAGELTTGIVLGRDDNVSYPPGTVVVN